jgi:hypothetical protein
MTNADTPSPLPPPSLDVLSGPVKEAYEATFLLTENLAEEDSPIADLVYNTQAVLLLLQYALEHEDQENLAPNFGQLTLEAMDYFYQRIDFQAGPRRKPERTPRERDLINAKVIGQELLCIEEALRQGKIAWGNAQNAQYWTESSLFQELSNRREELRNELLVNFG